MRVGRVVGRVTLSSVYDTLAGGRFLLVQVLDRFALAGKPAKPGDVLVAYDNLGAHDGDLIAFTESGEASAPFLPQKRVPLDALCTAILDEVKVQLEL